MIKNKFFKNLYQSISCFSGIMIPVFILLMVFVDSLKYEKNFGWFFLLISVSLIVLSFAFGFYWIFQKVIISEKGIKVVFIKKIIIESNWEEIESIEATYVMKNPALRVKLLNGSEIHLDKRKSIINAIENYSKIHIVK